MTSTLECPKCHWPLGEQQLNQPGLQPCPRCATPLQAEVFPAFFRLFTPGSAGEAVLIDNEASCFYHPQKKAIVPCEGCGRFLCALCDCVLHGQHFCPSCLEAGKKKGKIRNLENDRTLYDGIALGLAVVPIIFIYFTIITAPIALYVAIRYWNAPRSLVRPTKIRLIIAIIVALLQLLGWGLGIFFLTANKRHG